MKAVEATGADIQVGDLRRERRRRAEHHRRQAALRDRPAALRPGLPRRRRASTSRPSTATTSVAASRSTRARPSSPRRTRSEFSSSPRTAPAEPGRGPEPAARPPPDPLTVGTARREPMSTTTAPPPKATDAPARRAPRRARRLARDPPSPGDRRRGRRPHDLPVLLVTSPSASRSRPAPARGSSRPPRSAIMAVAVALLMIGGEFDLSAGVMTGFTGLVTGDPDDRLGTQRLGRDRRLAGGRAGHRVPQRPHGHVDRAAQLHRHPRHVLRAPGRQPRRDQDHHRPGVRGGLQAGQRLRRTASSSSGPS